MSKNILLVCGGGGTEHEISLISANYIKDTLKNISDFNIIQIEITKNKKWQTDDKKEAQLDFNKNLKTDSASIKIDYAIPCIHGWPGETGDIQSYFELIGLPYLGSNSEGSKIAFNKLTTKLWLNALNVPNTPFVVVSNNNEEILNFFRIHKKVIIKATNQGSSVGCYVVNTEKELKESIDNAFKYSDFVIVEKFVIARELEISAYEFNGKLEISNPGEIVCPSGFYSYDEKYSKDSKTKTITKALDLTDSTVQKMKDMVMRAFKGIKLKDLSRFDFFVSDNEIYLNEINTFPGLTPISMFPKMMEENGHLFKDFLIGAINSH